MFLNIFSFLCSELLFVDFGIVGISCNISRLISIVISVIVKKFVC